jgi:signal transduction histidine kinase
MRLLLKVLLVWNPLIVGGIILLLQPLDAFPHAFAISIIIATVVATFCFASVAGVEALETWIRRRRGRARQEQRKGRYFAVSVMAMPVGLFLGFEVASLVFGFPIGDGLAGYRSGLLIGGLIAGLFFLWQARSDSRDAARLATIRAHEAEKEELTAKLSALTAQMHPHLLFNALNTVAALIPCEPEKAEEMIVRLAELYRGVLSSTQRTTHPLVEELRLCRAYLAVEEARFGDRLRSSVELEAELDPEAIQIPVLVLQPLVENAVEHGVSRRGTGGSVAIRARAAAGHLELVVEDDGVGLGRSDRRGAGVGLDATRKRLALCHGDRASLELSARPGGGTLAVVRLPLPAAAGARVA